LARRAASVISAITEEVAHVAHRGRQVGRAHEQRVDAGHRRDGLELRQRRGRLELHDHRDALVGLAQVVGRGAEARGPRRAGHAAHALGRVARGRHGARRLGGVLHEGEQHRLRAGVEHALDGDGIVPGHAHHRHHLRVADGLQLVHHLHQVGRGVLHVDHAPVEAGVAQRLGHQRAGAGDPGACGGARAAGLEQVAEGVHGRGSVVAGTGAIGPARGGPINAG
jgi:hypothetical protein